MVGLFQKFFEQLQDTPPEQPLSVEQLHLATAALLTEVAAADGDFNETEMTTLQQLLKKRYSLSDDALTELTNLAKDQQQNATSLFEFTSLINLHCSAQEKYLLVEAMWEVAFTDGNVDKYEEHIIRRVADLIYVSHSDFIRAKMSAGK